MKYTITIYNEFFDRELTGEFTADTEAEAVNECTEEYAYELGTTQDEIKIISIKV